ncbi:MAG: hypothetical protein PHV37_09205 [Candidatus Gastranaerophilales bacterium]|nr:hypothetical protein [Candidatus Gastranaerophilales bacterium]
MSNFVSENLIKKARKEHRCDCCNSSVQVGESYVHIAGVWQGNFFTENMCPQCREILEIYLSEIENEYDIHFLLDEVFDYDGKRVYDLLKQIKHPSSLVLSYIEDYEEKLGVADE